MPKEYPYSRATDVDEDYLTPTDVKQYMFCPLVTYFTRVLRLRPIMGSQQEEAKKSHNRLTGLERRRESVLKVKLPFGVMQKEFDIPLYSERLRVLGRLDMLVVTDEGEHIPVEFKDMTSHRGQVLLDHKYQLVCLALLLEDVNRVIVRRGLAHYMNDETTVQVLLTHSLKRRTEHIISAIKQMVESGERPSPRPQCRRTLVGCGFADQCRDLV
ncbi:MAG: CRISPR-associated protein Cas4 [Candidatus Thorarchaeota archaeon]|nr:CRISPR-associated protein Cas4 [Candidatus Thorarchaeota archaeon]